jgi:tetratricopeptide (TPR) repeat protein
MTSDMKKLKSFIKGNKGCLYLIVIFGLFVLSIKACDYYDDIETDHFNSLKNEGDSLMYKGEYESAIEKYMSALKIHSSGTNYTLPSYSSLANCYELLGKYDCALYYLDKYDHAAGGICFSNIHRAIIYAKKNDRQTSRNLLDRILNQPLKFDQPSLWATLTDRWLHSKNDYSESKAYLEYLFTYYCKLIALRFRAGLSESESEYMSYMDRIFNLATDEESVIENFRKFIGKGTSIQFSFLEYTDYQRAHIWGYPIVKNTSVDEIVYRLKWLMASEYLIFYDSKKGYHQTKQHFTKIIGPHSGTIENFPKFLIGVYMNLDRKGKLPTKLSYDDFEKLRCSSMTPDSTLIMSFIIKASPSKLNQNNYPAKESFVRPAIVLKCNDWDMDNDSVSLHDYVKSQQSKEKTMIILKEDYTINSVKTNEDYFGVNLEYIAVPKMFKELIKKEFNWEELSGNLPSKTH